MFSYKMKMNYEHRSNIKQKKSSMPFQIVAVIILVLLILYFISPDLLSKTFTTIARPFWSFESKIKNPVPISKDLDLAVIKDLEKENMELARQLLNDPKEVAEHNMLVDLHRNDLGKAAKFGTVKVRSLMDIKKFSHVQHISSEISGVIKDGCDMFCALSASFPAGTLTGAPKVESMKIISRMEKSPRGPYGGAVGHFGFDGNCIFAISIRSLFVSGKYAFAQTSGGVVLDSDPDKEYEEITNKLAAMKEVLK